MAEGQRRADGRGPLQDGERDAGRGVEQRRNRPLDDTGDDAGADAPHHQGPGQRCGRDVGGQRRERHGTEGRDQHRRHRQLGPDGHPERLAHPAGTGEAGDDGRREQQHARARGDAEPEAHRSGEERVDEQEGAHGERQVAEPAGGPARGARPHRHHGHDRRPHHRRLEPGEEGEPGHRAGRQHEPGPEAQPAQQGSRDGEHEEHVGPGDGQQVRQARGAEVGRELGGLRPVVAEGQPGEQRPVAIRQRRRAPVERAPKPVGHRGVRRSAADRGHGLDAEPAGQVPRHGPVAGALERRDLAAHRDALAGQASTQELDRGGRPRLGEEAPAVEPDVHPHPSRDRGLGIGHERHGGVDPAGLLGLQPGQRARCQPGGEDAEGQAGHGERRPAGHRRASERPEAGQHDGAQHRARSRGGEVGADPCRQCQRDDGEVGAPVDRRRAGTRLRHARGPAARRAWPRRCPAPRAAPPRWRRDRAARGAR